MFLKNKDLNHLRSFSADITISSSLLTLNSKYMKKIFDFKQVVAIFAASTLFACTQSDFEIEQGMES